MKASYFLHSGDIEEDIKEERFIEVKLSKELSPCGHYPVFQNIPPGKISKEELALHTITICLICDGGLIGTPLPLVTILEDEDRVTYPFVIRWEELKNLEKE